MKRLIVAIDGVQVGPEEIKEATRAASREKNTRSRKPKRATKRVHRAMSADEREAKALQSAQRKRERNAEREAKEAARLARRVAYFIKRGAREMEKSTKRIIITYRDNRRPKFKEVCPRSLYRRVHPQLPKIPSRPARTAADGFRNIVLKRSSRGFGRKQPGTRAYAAGEVGRAARYSSRPEALEKIDGAVVTNVLGDELISEACFNVDQQAEIVGFFQALEEIEKAVGGSHVYSHIIFAMPYELGPEGRAAALREFCEGLSALGLMFSAALHKPDPEGSERNFHAHIVLGCRPAIRQGPFCWSFEAAKSPEFNTPAGTKFFRARLADCFNAQLEKHQLAMRYDARSQAERGVPSLGESHKGQKVVARERALGALSERADKVLKGAVARTVALFSEYEKALMVLQRLHDYLQLLADERKRKAERTRSAGVQEPQPKAEVLAIPPTGPALPSQATLPLSAPPPTSRNHILSLALAEYAGNLPADLERIYVELRRQPQAIAMAITSTGLHVAYKLASVQQSLGTIINDPRKLAWVTRLAERLDFDHASVPADWQWTDAVPGSLLIAPSTETYWSSRFGGKTPNIMNAEENVASRGEGLEF